MRKRGWIFVAVLVTGVAGAYGVKDYLSGGRPGSPPITGSSKGIPVSQRSTDAVVQHAPALKAELKKAGFQYGAPLLIRIFKQPGTLEVWLQKGQRFERFKTYKICTFSGNLGPKLKEGDGQSPEGFYSVKPGQLNPNSRYYLSFNLGYPNAYDRAHQRTGSALMVHGNCVSVGCYAMTDARIGEIYTLVQAAFENGQPAFQVQAYPFALTAANLKRHQSSPWYGFWLNLKQGYDDFEQQRLPPQVGVKDKRYTFAQ